MIAALLAAALGCQEPEPPPTRPVPAVQAQAPADWNDKEAKEAVKAYRQKTKGNLSLTQKMQALEDLGKGRHEELIPVLAAVIQSEKAITVRRRAAELLAWQPADAARSAIVKLLTTVADQPAVLAELVRGLQRIGYQPRQWADLDGLFDKDYSTERVVLQDAILDLVIAKKEGQAIELLLRNLDEPVPANVDDPANPGAAYWEARWKAWRSWRTKLKDALFTVTGQRFSTAAEARAWLKKNPVK
jgi:HEAT repeat protein